MQVEKWVAIEKVYDSFPQAFATTYDNAFADAYYRKLDLSKTLGKHLLIFEGTTVSLCNLKENFETHVKEIFEKVVKEPFWAGKVNKENLEKLQQFQRYVDTLEKLKNSKELDVATEIENFFTIQQIAHVSAWPMAIVDWEKTLFSHHLKNELLGLGVNQNELEVVFSELTTAYPPNSEASKTANARIKENKHLSELFEVARETIQLKRLRKNIFSEAFKSLYKLWELLALKSDLPVELVKFAYPWEVKALLSGKISEEELRKRSKFHIFYSTTGQRLILSGKQAREFVNRLSFEKEATEKETKEIRGSVAFKGKVKGTVKIVNSVKDVAKIDKGNILVSHMAEPSFTAGFQKCAAIVTDQGGITCHAAIVARELQKPCVIGTKNASQILKDNDVVEVDAFEGIVKVLSKV